MGGRAQALENRRTDSDDARGRLIVVLQQLAEDYPEAIEGGAGSDLPEQVALARAATATLLELGPTGERVRPLVQRLQGRVERGVDALGVRADAEALVARLVAEGGVPSHPDHAPSLERGALLYDRSCGACHGPTGGGGTRVGASLRPPPSSFQDSDRMNNLSPFQAYGAVTFGVLGTAMPSFAEAYSDEDRWAVVAYLFTLRLPPCAGPAPDVATDWLFSSTDRTITAAFGEAGLACVRRLTPSRLASTRPTGGTGKRVRCLGDGALLVLLVGVGFWAGGRSWAAARRSTTVRPHGR